MDERLDHLLLGMVDRLVSVRGYVHRQDLKRKNHQAVYQCHINSTDYVFLSVVQHIWRCRLENGAKCCLG